MLQGVGFAGRSFSGYNFWCRYAVAGKSGSDTQRERKEFHLIQLNPLFGLFQDVVVGQEVIVQDNPGERAMSVLQDMKSKQGRVALIFVLSTGLISVGV